MRKWILVLALAATTMVAAQDRIRACPAGGCDPDPEGFTCTDTDNGKRPAIAGTVTLYYYGSYVASYSDYCSNSSTLIEHWCTSSGGWTTTTYYCTTGCSGGVCPNIPPP
jgi:hypothetical protein